MAEEDALESVKEMHVVVVANGIIEDQDGSRAIAERADLLLCANGGALSVLGWGLTPAAVIGDMDSLDVETLGRLERAGVKLDRFAPRKDATDLELALDRAVDSGATRITILGALGGRIDQTLGNIMLLTQPRLAGISVRIQEGDERLVLVCDTVTIRGEAGDTVSLLPLSRKVTHVTTDGLEYPLQDELLYQYASRGISNRMLANVATVTIGDGLLLVIHRLAVS